MNDATLFFTLLVTFAFSSGCVSGAQAAPQPDARGFEMPAAKAIAWEPVRQEKETTEISGSVRADFGTFELWWVIEKQGSARLVTREPSGSAELPLMEKQLWPLVFEGGLTAIFQEWYPLVNVKAPTTVRLIVTVPSKELFSAFSDGLVPPEERLPKKLLALRWDGATDDDGVRRVRGVIWENTKGFALLWERRVGRQPALVGEAASRTGKGEPLASRLIPWVDEHAGNTMILEAVASPEGGGTLPHLIPLFVVNTKDLMRGFDQAR
jgi:hypothetical protein